MISPRTGTPTRLVAAVLAVLVAVAALVAAPAAPAAAAGDRVADEARFYELTNLARVQHGQAPLQYDPAASAVARSWAEELARSRDLRHNPDLVAAVDAWVTNQWTRIGENVGYGPSIDVTQDAYMASTGHRNNILGDFNRLGVGVAYSADGRVWSVAVFVKGPALPPTAPLVPQPTVPASTFAPHRDALAFAAQQYDDLLVRTADPAGLAVWAGALSSGAKEPAGMVADLIGSSEAQLTVGPVARLYKAYFRRIPDAEGLRYWVWRLRTGTSLGQVSAGFAESAEFRSTYGALDDAGFVDLVYRNVLGRPADAAGAAYWRSQLAAGRLDRGGVMVNFSESAENRGATLGWVAVVHVYAGLLRKAPDQATLDSWVPRLHRGTPLVDLVRAVLDSPEYAARF